MAIPTPSFFKIRLKIIIVGFFVLFFFIGLLKNLFAGWPGECSYSVATPLDPGTNDYRGLGRCTSDPVAGTFDVEVITYAKEWRFDKEYQLIWYYWENGKWTVKYSWTTQCDEMGFTPDYSSYYDLPVDGCPDCDAEEAQLTVDCGGDEGVEWEWTDEVNCVGECIPCREPLEEGQETMDQAAQRCIQLDKNVSYYDIEKCKGVCDGCTEEQYISEKEKCGVLPFVFNEVTCKSDCDFSCPDGLAMAQALCGPGATVISYETKVTIENGCEVPESSVTCDEGVTVLYPRYPTDEGVPSPNDPESPPSPDDPESPPSPDDPEDPQPTEPAPDPDDPTDNNEWNETIANNQKVQIKQNDEIIANQNEQSTLLNWIGENQKITASNTDAIAKALQDGSVKAELGEKALNELGEIEDGIRDVEGVLDNISNGEYVSPGEEEAYTSEEHDFSTRTTDFLNQMKSTGLFAIPNQLASAIPSGGSSVLVIHSGETFGGDHSIDYNDISEGLDILKYILHIAFATIAIRIITLKR